MPVDINVNCRSCFKRFVFSVEEQEFFSSCGLTNSPKRCHNCRLVSRVQRVAGSTEGTSAVHCADCGTRTVVPFIPKNGKPIYCNQCFRNKRQQPAASLDTVESIAI